MRINIVVPVHNEAKVLEPNVRSMIEQLQQIPDIDWELMIVENGSRDDTLAIAQKISDEFQQVQCLSLNNANYGIALKEGFLASKGDVIVNFDIDYWDVEFLEIASHVMTVKYDIIIASKNLLLSKDRRGWLRKIASYTFRMILFFLFGLRVSDTHGIKAWRNSEKLRNYFKQSVATHHTYDTEVIVRAMHDHCEVLEVPAEVLETRETDHHILKRVPQTLKELWDMFKRLKLEHAS